MSLPSWERGLKSSVFRDYGFAPVVAPLVGAWIEIVSDWGTTRGVCSSLPSWERGLKLSCDPLSNAKIAVAPLVGAWIEIYNKRYAVKTIYVAPLVGAWIEIL